MTPVDLLVSSAIKSRRRRSSMRLEGERAIGVDRRFVARYSLCIFSPSDQPETASDGVFLFWRGGIWNL